jgi:Fe-S-cluster-containing hydrogenase component 2
VGRKAFVACDPEKCVGCRICEYVCSLKKAGVFNPTKSRIRVIRVHNPPIDWAITCRKCDDPPCIRACPRKGALVQRRDGLIIVDEEKCNGCGWCIEACDFGAIALSEGKVVVICDTCGGEPECIQWCPEEALSLTTKDILAQKARIDVIRKFSGSI